MNTLELKSELKREYEMRFSMQADYRYDIWKLLTAKFFQSFIPTNSTILDLGCGWGQFINQIQAAKKYGMDLNPQSHQMLSPEVEFLEQDCSMPWDVKENSLDFVFTSNFFEHLSSKSSLRSTLQQAHRCLKPGGKIICMGPNIRYLPGQYWDFWDHYLALTDQSLCEGLEILNFKIEKRVARFIPYTMVGRKPTPLILVDLYLKMPWIWRFFGKQFLVIAQAHK